MAKDDGRLKLPKSRLRPELQKINRAKTNHGKAKFFAEGGEMKAKAKKMNPFAKFAKVADKDGDAMKCGGKVKKMAKGGGVEIKGKTKGKFIKM